MRAPALAGTWYPAEAPRLREGVRACMRGAGRPASPILPFARTAASLQQEGTFPAAIVAPHAGHRWSGPCAGAVFDLARGARFRRLLLLGPSHRERFAGVALPQDDTFATPLGPIPLDGAALAMLDRRPSFHRSDRAHAEEHSLEIELPFAQETLAADFTLIPLLVGRLDDGSRDDAATAIRELWDLETLLVVSSDFTHFGADFGYEPFDRDVAGSIARLDARAVAHLLALDLHGFESFLDESGATICGANPLRILLAAAAGRRLQPGWVDYFRSADKTGDFDHSVSYVGLAFYGETVRVPDSTTVALARPESALLHVLARRAVAEAVEGRDAEPLHAGDVRHLFGPDTPLAEPHGVFVTLRSAEHELRGCIGRVESESSLVEAVQDCAAAAATRDTRFASIAAKEVASLSIEISILSPSRRVSHPEEIVLGRDGVVLEAGGRRALFLPQVAIEHGWSLSETLEQLARKAGLPSSSIRNAELSVFRTRSFAE